MILLVSTLVVILVVTYAQFRNGLFTSLTMLIQVVLSGVVAFNFWEPLADPLDGAFVNGTLEGYEDWLVLTALFSVTLLVLRAVSNKLNPEMINYQGLVQQIGGALIGAVTGYLVAGFLICAISTLPVAENTFGLEPRRPDEPGFRSYFPPDRVWLALMRYASAHSLAWTAEDWDEDAESVYDRYRTFDRHGTFELRYSRYRRSNEQRDPLPYQGEFEKQLNRGE